MLGSAVPLPSRSDLARAGVLTLFLCYAASPLPLRHCARTEADSVYGLLVADDASTLGGKVDEKEPEAPNVVMHMVKQLMPGQDLTRVTIPSFFLENRSLLEKLADVMMHPHLIVNVASLEDPADRMVSVLRWFMSGWHYKTSGVKKPYNPVIGETFGCVWTHEDGSRSQYFAEQVSHRPPVSAMFLENRQRNITANAHVWTKSRFKAPQTAQSIMEGGIRLRLTNLDEDYFLTMPSFFAHGLLVGTLRMEIGGTAHIICEKTGLRTEINFKQKPMIGGDANVVSGTIKQGKKKLFDFAGKWDAVINITDRRGGKKTDVLVDVRTEPIAAKEALPVDLQGPWESRRLWHGVTEALSARPKVDWMHVDRLKGAIEDAQRLLPCHQEGDAKEPWNTKRFHLVPFRNPLTGTTEEVWEMDLSVYRPYGEGERANNVIWLSRMTPDVRTGDPDPLPGIGADAVGAAQATSIASGGDVGSGDVAAAGGAGGAGGAKPAAKEPAAETSATADVSAPSAPSEAAAPSATIEASAPSAPEAVGVVDDGAGAGAPPAGAATATTAAAAAAPALPNAVGPTDRDGSDGDADAVESARRVVRRSLDSAETTFV